MLVGNFLPPNLVRGEIIDPIVSCVGTEAYHDRTRNWPDEPIPTDGKQSSRGFHLIHASADMKQISLPTCASSDNVHNVGVDIDSRHNERRPLSRKDRLANPCNEVTVSRGITAMRGRFCSSP